MQPKHLAVLISLWNLLRETFSEWSKDSAMVLGAALAFYTLFSLAPLLIILTVVAGYFLGQQAVQATILERLSEYVGLENARNLMDIIQSTYEPGSSLFATLTAVSLMLFGASSVFLMLKHALNNIWGVTKAASGLISLVTGRLKSFLGVLGIGFLLFLGMVLKSLLLAFYETVSRFLVVPGLILALSENLLSFLLISTLFTVLFKVLPDTRVSWLFAGRGGVVSAFLFTIGNIFLGFYLTRQTVASAYGAAGSLVVILLWVYYSALIIFLGAEFTQVYARRRGQAMDEQA